MQSSGGSLHKHSLSNAVVRRGTSAGISRSKIIAGKFIPALLSHAFEIALRQSIEHPNSMLPSKQGFQDVLNGYGIWLQPIDDQQVTWKMITEGVKQLMTTMSTEGFATGDVGLYDSGILVVVGQILERP